MILYIVKKLEKHVLGFQTNTSGFSDKTLYSLYSPYDEVTVHSLHLPWITERCKNKDLGKYQSMTSGCTGQFIEAVIIIFIFT